MFSLEYFCKLKGWKSVYHLFILYCQLLKKLPYTYCVRQQNRIVVVRTRKLFSQIYIKMRNICVLNFTNNVSNL